MTIQLYRNPHYISKHIEQITKLIPMPCRNEPNDQLLRILYDYYRFKSNQKLFKNTHIVNSAIAESIEKNKNHKINIIVAPYNTSFFSSDSPAYSIGNKCPYMGIYMPISPKTCLWLQPNEKPLELKHYNILDADEKFVKFVNWLTAIHAKEHIIFNKEIIEKDIEKTFSSDFIL